MLSINRYTKYINAYKQRKNLKLKLARDLLPVAWHPGRAVKIGALDEDDTCKICSFLLDFILQNRILSIIKHLLFFNYQIIVYSKKIRHKDPSYMNLLIIISSTNYKSTITFR